MQWGSRLAFATIMIAVAWSAAAQEVSVTDAWARATVPGQRATGAFMDLIASRDAAIVSAESPVAGLVEVHQMVMEGTIMKMRPVERLELPAGEKVELKPGGYHAMLMDLKQPLRKGDMVPLTLRIEEKDGTVRPVQVTAEVLDPAAAAQHGRP